MRIRKVLQRGRILALVAVLAGLAISPGCASQRKAGDPSGREWAVTEVLSGNTLRLADGRVVCYCGVEALPEEDPLYAASLEANRQVVGSGPVRILLERPRPDEKGRWVGHVYRAARLYGDDKYLYVNAEMILRGLARYRPCPGSTHPDLLLNLREMEGYAREGRRGIWGDREGRRDLGSP